MGEQDQLNESNEINMTNGILDLEESFYFDQESLKTIWDESDKSLGIVHATAELLERQEKEIKQRIENIYSKAKNAQLHKISAIFQAEKAHLGKIAQILNEAKKQVNKLPDLDPEQWQYIDQDKIKDLQMLHVRLLIDENADNLGHDTELVNINSVSSPDVLTEICRNPNYQKYKLGLAHNTGHRSSTPFLEEETDASQSTLTTYIEIDENNNEHSLNETVILVDTLSLLPELQINQDIYEDSLNEAINSADPTTLPAILQTNGDIHAHSLTATFNSVVPASLSANLPVNEDDHEKLLNETIYSLEPIFYADVECEVLSAYEPNYWLVRLKHGPDNAYFDRDEVQRMLEKMNSFYTERDSRNPMHKDLQTIYEVDNENSDDFGFEFTYSSMSFKLDDLVVLNKSVDDGTWKRGKVLEIHDNQSKVNVLLVDEGTIKFGVPIEELRELVEQFKRLRSDIYCVCLEDINDVNLRTIPLHVSPVEEMAKDENLFNSQIFLRFSELEECEREDIVDVFRLSKFSPYPAKMILTGNKRNGDPFAPPTYNIFQKDVSKYLISKGLATEAYAWQDPTNC